MGHRRIFDSDVRCIFGAIPANLAYTVDVLNIEHIVNVLNMELHTVNVLKYGTY